MPKIISDPALYRRLAEPVESQAVALKLGDDFFRELSALREKYHVPEVAISFGINVKNADGTESLFIQSGHRGGQSTDRLILDLVKRTRFGSTLLALVDELVLAALK